MTDSQPVAQLLGVLRAARGRTVLTDHLRSSIPAYGCGDLGRRRLQRDLNILTTRGLVTTTITDDLAGNRDGVRLVTYTKPMEFHLTSAEHLALAQARAALRLGVVAVSPLPDGPATPQAQSLDELMRLLRIVEERGVDQGVSQNDPVRVGELAVLLGVTRDRVVELIREADDLREAGLFPGLIVRYGDDTDTDELGIALADDFDDVVAVAIIRTTAKPRSSLNLGLGLDELGRFAYTRAECDDRLLLLEEAMDTWGEDDRDFDTYESAHLKLMSWRDTLPEYTAADARIHAFRSGEHGAWKDVWDRSIDD